MDRSALPVPEQNNAGNQETEDGLKTENRKIDVKPEKRRKAWERALKKQRGRDTTKRRKR